MWSFITGPMNHTRKQHRGSCILIRSLTKREVFCGNKPITQYRRFHRVALQCGRPMRRIKSLKPADERNESIAGST